MHKALIPVLLTLPLAGCLTSTDVPPVDGIYNGSLTTASGSDTILAVIDTNGNGMIIDQTNPAIMKFTIPSSAISSDGTFTVPVTDFAGAGFNNISATTGTSTSISGTLDGDNEGDRSTINGTIGGLSFNLTYNSGAYTSYAAISQLTTASSNGIQPSLNFSYTPENSSSGTAASNISLTLSSTASSNGGYEITGTNTVPNTSGSGTTTCNFSGNITMPNGGYNAYEFNFGSYICNGVSYGTSSGLAYYNNTATPSITLEFDDGSNFAVASPNVSLTY